MPVNKKKLAELKAQAAKVSIPVFQNSAISKYSLGVINSVRNGRRINISKSMTLALKLEDSVSFAFVPSEGILLVGKKLDVDPRIDSPIKCAEGACTVYCAAAVMAITNLYGLDFTNKVSMSFSDVEIDSSDVENPVAIIAMKKVN